MAKVRRLLRRAGAGNRLLPVTGSGGRVTRRIIQFGTRRFLQAHIEFFVHEARLAGENAGPIAVVQTSGSVARTGRVAAFGRRRHAPATRTLEAIIARQAALEATRRKSA